MTMSRCWQRALAWHECRLPQRHGLFHRLGQSYQALNGLALIVSLDQLAAEAPTTNVIQMQETGVPVMYMWVRERENQPFLVLLFPGMGCMPDRFL